MHKDRVYSIRCFFFQSMALYMFIHQKIVFHDARPYDIFDEGVTETYDDYLEKYNDIRWCSMNDGMPSGHTSFSTWASLHMT